MKKIETYPWDAAEHLETKEDIASYLEAALEDGDPAVLVAALKDIVRSQGMIQIARETGHDRAIIDKVLSAKEDPDLATVFKLLQTLGLRLQVVMI